MFSYVSFIQFLMCKLYKIDHCMIVVSFLYKAVYIVVVVASMLVCVFLLKMCLYLMEIVSTVVCKWGSNDGFVDGGSMDSGASFVDDGVESVVVIGSVVNSSD